MIEPMRGKKPTLGTAAAIVVATSIAGCSGGANSVTGASVNNTAATSATHLTELTGAAALEDGQVRVRVVDQTGNRLRTQALPATWSNANLRLVSNSTFTGNGGAASNSRLTADRAVTLPSTAFTANSSTCGGTATACQVTSAIFTKMRPGNYLLQVSLDNGTLVGAVQSVSLTVTGGATTSLIVTLATTTTGTNTITVTSAGTETYSGGTPGSGNLNNSTTHTTALSNTVLVKGDTINSVSPLTAGEATTANTPQNTSPSVPPGGVNGAVTFATGQVSRIVASLRACAVADCTGADLTVSTNVPQNTEKIIANWFDSGTEAKTAVAWNAFFGTGSDGAGVVPNIDTATNVDGSARVTGLNTAISFTVPGGVAGNTGPNDTGVPALTPNTTEVGTNNDRSVVMIYRFYDNTWEHRYIGARVTAFVLDDAAAIQTTVN